MHFVGSPALPAVEEKGGRSNVERGLLVFRIEFHTMSGFHQAGISPGTEREAPAVPGKVTPGADVLPGSGRDTVWQRDFQMCLGRKIQSSIPLAHRRHRTHPATTQAHVHAGSEPQGQDRGVPLGQDPQPRAPRSSQGITLGKVPGILLQRLCALLAADLRLILSFNLSDFYLQALGSYYSLLS